MKGQELLVNKTITKSMAATPALIPRVANKYDADVLPVSSSTMRISWMSSSGICMGPSIIESVPSTK